ncbi:MAG TPA: UDP-N-acetylmuramate dehydrogenase [Anaerolineales bacterium]|nr:UDP-N-acetylmuramate dehydrogenase [Anaerolineales bacterium]
MISSRWLEQLEERFADRLQFNQPLAKYTSARIGGPADVLLMAQSAADLEEIVSSLWKLEIPFLVIGGGSNMLISDAGVREVVVLNKARKVRFDMETPSVWAESGSNFGALARQAGRKGLSGLEWAAGIPGTVGGAVVGNAGAHGGDTAGNLMLAEVLHHTQGRKEWSPDDLELAYRSSKLKQQPGEAVVLAASFKLSFGQETLIKEKMEEFLTFRKQTQPPGASMGSMFKNPPGDHAGRLIDAAGLKGTRIGDAQISDLHANFFINHGGARATDVYSLIRKAQQAVLDEFGIQLELEIGLIGDWKR